MSHRPFALWGCLLALLLAAPPLLAQAPPRVDGAPVLLAGGEEAPFAHPAWSPDGSRIAFTRPNYMGLWVMEVQNRTIQEVTDEAAAGFGFSWSPDGRALLARVARFEGPRRLNAIKAFDLERGEELQLTDYRGMMPALPRWGGDGTAVFLPSPDGLEVLEGLPRDNGLVAAPTDAPLAIADDAGLRAFSPAQNAAVPPRLLDERRVLNATPSPDGTRIAFEVMGGNLHVINADGSGLVDLGPGHRPSWSPDGQWVAFMRTEDDGKRFTAADLYAARADGGLTVPLTATADRLEMNPSWSPDGRWIAFDDLDEGAIYILPLAR